MTVLEKLQVSQAWCMCEYLCKSKYEECIFYYCCGLTCSLKIVLLYFLLHSIWEFDDNISCVLSHLAQHTERHLSAKPTWVSVDVREDSSSLDAGGKDSLSGGGSDCGVEALIFPSSDFALCSDESFPTPGPFICCCPWAWAFALCCRLSKCCWYQYCCCSYNKQIF